jgi:hypothetical protein
MGVAETCMGVRMLRWCGVDAPAMKAGGACARGSGAPPSSGGICAAATLADFRGV